jgi:hypothetical protein
LDRAGEGKNGTATDEVIKEQAELFDQQMSVMSFVHKNQYESSSRNEIIVKMSTV